MGSSVSDAFTSIFSVPVRFPGSHPLFNLRSISQLDSEDFVYEQTLWTGWNDEREMFVNKHSEILSSALAATEGEHPLRIMTFNWCCLWQGIRNCARCARAEIENSPLPFTP